MVRIRTGSMGGRSRGGSPLGMLALVGLLGGRRGRRGGRGGGGARLVIAAVIALVAVGGFLFSTTENPLTGRSQRVALSFDQEVALGYQSKPQLVAQMGGAVPMSSPKAQAVAAVGEELLSASGLRQQLADKDVPWRFTFTLLDDPNTVNAFALPGGPVFVTTALYDRMENVAQLAGVLGHEIGHVVERHGAQRMAQSQMFQQLAGAAAVGTGDISAAQAASVAGEFIGMRYGREQELESDKYGLEYLVVAGYDPRQMVRVMEILRDASGGGGGRPEFMQTHPHPESRIAAIEAFVNALDEETLNRLGDGGRLPR